jgi:NAD(P)-dependent dehydrogenase (short-subunit alcohol dehydrogenase family)
MTQVPDMTRVIVITGASSGLGRLAAHALAKSGHTVYAGVRDIAGRNAPQMEASQDAVEIVNGVADRVRAELLRRIGLADLLHPTA